MKKLNSGYIMSVVSAVLLLLEVIGVKVDIPYVNEVMMAVLGVLVALGIVAGAGNKGGKKSGDDGSTIGENVPMFIETEDEDEKDEDEQCDDTTR